MGWKFSIGSTWYSPSSSSAQYNPTTYVSTTGQSDRSCTDGTFVGVTGKCKGRGELSTTPTASTTGGRTHQATSRKQSPSVAQEQVYQKLQQLSQEKQVLEMREKQTHQQAQQRFEQLQQEAGNQIKRLSEDNMRLQAELEDSRKSAEGQMNFVKLQAETERQRAVAELKELSSKLEAIMTHPERVGSASGTMMGSPIGNPFEHLPQAYQSAQPTEILSAGASVASANPLEVMYCTCCGSQNVIGRPSCWRCSTLLSTVTAKNGADLSRIQDHSFDPAPCPPPSLAPSSFRASQGVAAGSASIAAPAAAPMAITARLPGGCASNAAPSGNLASGGLMGQTGCGLGVGSNGGMANQWGGFDPNGPRIQAGYIVPGRGHQSEKPKPAGLQGSFSIRTPKNSSPSNGSSSSSKDSNGEGLIQAPKDGWLLPDETDEVFTGTSTSSPFRSPSFPMTRLRVASGVRHSWPQLAGLT